MWEKRSWKKKKKSTSGCIVLQTLAEMVADLNDNTHKNETIALCKSKLKAAVTSGILRTQNYKTALTNTLDVNIVCTF